MRAARLYGELAEGSASRLGHDHPSVAEATLRVGQQMALAGEHAEAAAAFRSRLDWLQTQGRPPASQEVVEAQAALGEALLRTGQLSEARPLLRQAVEARHAAEGKSAEQTEAALRTVSDQLDALQKEQGSRAQARAEAQTWLNSVDEAKAEAKAQTRHSSPDARPTGTAA